MSLHDRQTAYLSVFARFITLLARSANHRSKSVSDPSDQNNSIDQRQLLELLAHLPRSLSALCMPSLLRTQQARLRVTCGDWQCRHTLLLRRGVLQLFGLRLHAIATSFGLQWPLLRWRRSFETRARDWQAVFAAACSEIQRCSSRFAISARLRARKERKKRQNEKQLKLARCSWARNRAPVPAAACDGATRTRRHRAQQRPRRLRPQSRRQDGRRLAIHGQRSSIAR